MRRSTLGFPGEFAQLRWLLVAASGRAAAEAFAHRSGIAPQLTLSKADLMTRPSRLRETIRNSAIDGAILHSADWQRQRNPQLYEALLALMPVRERYLADDERGSVSRLSAASMGARIARIPIHAMQAAAVIGIEEARLLGLRRPFCTPVDAGGVPTGSSILAFWRGTSDGFGGSVTHISGILGGFRRCGFRVGLVTCWPPPDQVRAVVDDVIVIAPLRAAMRMSTDTEHIGSNEPLRRAGAELARRLQPTFVYQRHSPFLVAGADLAGELEIPLVLEWNGSVEWVRENWQEQLPIERLLDPLLVSMERNVASRATVVAAVSRAAAAMALRVGAAPERTHVVPNGVDVADVDSSLNGHTTTRAQSAAVLGWAGSFGPWHGAEVAVEALAKLPPSVRLVMVGDGKERPSCERLARALGVEERIEWTGGVDRITALRKLVQCDILVSPHTPLKDQPFFGSPTKIFEYMALGKPIVASRLGQIGEVLEHDVTALLVTPGDVDELAEAIGRILQAPDRGRPLGDAARREVAAEHTWDDRARAIVGHLGSVGEPHAARHR